MFLRKPFKYSFFNATLILLIANIAVYILQSLNIAIRIGNTYFDITYLFSAHYYFIKVYHFWWQPVTYMFVHGSASHIIFNMLALLVFGFSVEKAVGSKEFLLFYFFCGIFDGILSVTLYWNMQYPVFIMGASGAIYAVLFMYAVIFPRNKLFIWGVIPVRAPILVLIYAALAIFSQTFSTSQGTAHLTHLLGFALAWVYMVVRMGVHPIRVWRDSF